MKEKDFVKAVCRLLPAEVYQQGMAASSFGSNGTPDRYFDYKRDLWVEFKMTTTHGRNGYDVGGTDRSMLSGLQKRWLRRRWKAGPTGNACVIVGVPSDRTRGFVLESPDEWEAIVTPDVFIPRLMFAPELANYILKRVS